MLDAWELVPDLVGLAVFAFLYALLWVLTAILAIAFGTLDAVFGWIPGYGGLQRSLAAKVHDGCTKLMDGVTDGMTWCLNGIVDTLALVVGSLMLFSIGVWYLLKYLEQTAIPKAEQAAVREASDLIGDVPFGFRSAVAWVDSQVGALAGSIATEIGHIPSGYDNVTAWVHDLVKGVELDVTNLYKHDVKPIADELAATIRPMLKQLGKDAAALDAAVDAASGELAAELPHLPTLTWDELSKLLESKNFKTLTELLGAGGLAYLLTHALAAETGLTNGECRKKVKQICATDASQWENLLGGLAALGFAFSLADLARIAEPLVRELEPVIAAAA